MPRLSVVIPTRDRPDLLADALATLVAQDAPHGLFDVLVVDDGSEPPLAEVVERFAGAPVPIRVHRQEPGGLNVGRNTGAAHTTGDLIAYLDDDVLVAEGWARGLVEAFDSWGADAVAGRIVLKLEGPEPAWLTPGLRLYLSELDLGGDPRWLTGDETPFGANCAITRAAFERAGGFAAGLDRIGASLVSNGEVDFYRRVRGGGGRLLYWPESCVRHRVPPPRLTLEWFLRRAHAQGVSDALMHPAPKAAVVGREMVRAGRAAPILARSLARGHGAAGARIWLAYCRGRASAGLRHPSA